MSTRKLICYGLWATNILITTYVGLKAGFDPLHAVLLCVSLQTMEMVSCLLNREDLIKALQSFDDDDWKDIKRRFGF